MQTKHECKSSYYSTYYVICPVCKERAGYDHCFDFGVNKVFTCKCGKTLSEIKKNV